MRGFLKGSAFSLTHATVVKGRSRAAAWFLILLLLPTSQLVALNGIGDYYHKWRNGPPADSAYFPIAVWLQSPSNADKYRRAGINLYVGLWEGPTESQIAQLRRAGMPVMCAQNNWAQAHLDEPIIVGWTHDDEPDNAQWNGSSYDPCIAPAVIVDRYRSMVEADSTRPVYLNLGMGVAYTSWIGRGDCTGKTDMYQEYAEGADILSFDIYPVTSDIAAVRGKLGYVAIGIDNLRKWSGDRKPVWNWIECTRISSNVKPTPRQVRSEVWLSLIHGANGIGYFCHEFSPAFKEAALLDDHEMLAAVTEINAQIRELAPLLNRPHVDGRVQAVSSNRKVKIDVNVKQRGDELYIFAVGNGEGEAVAEFHVPAAGEVEVLYENRRLPLVHGSFSDTFSASYDVHLYRVTMTASVNGGAPRPENIELYPCFPNPFSRTTTLSWRLYAPQEMELAVFDMRGKRVRTLSAGAKAAGLHQAEWNGCDDTGCPLPQGIYLYRLKSGSSQTAGRLLLLR